MIKLKEIRRSKGITVEELAEYTGIDKNVIMAYEDRSLEPDLETMSIIAKCLRAGETELYGLPRIGIKKGVKIPVLGSVAAGIPIEAITDIEDYEEITEEMANTGEFIALRIKGNSMSPKIENGDIVIIRAQNTIENGEIAIVLVEENEATCKKIEKTPGGITLIPFNKDYDSVFYSNEAIESLPVRIFGKVVELRRSISF